jgi:hypothetical protein
MLAIEGKNHKFRRNLKGFLRRDLGEARLLGVLFNTRLEYEDMMLVPEEGLNDVTGNRERADDGRT